MTLSLSSSDVNQLLSRYVTSVLDEDEEDGGFLFLLGKNLKLMSEFVEKEAFPFA